MSKILVHFQGLLTESKSTWLTTFKSSWLSPRPKFLRVRNQSSQIIFKSEIIWSTCSFKSELPLTSIYNTSSYILYRFMFNIKIIMAFIINIIMFLHQNIKHNKLMIDINLLRLNIFSLFDDDNMYIND